MNTYTRGANEKVQNIVRKKEISLHFIHVVKVVHKEPVLQKRIKNL